MVCGFMSGVQACERELFWDKLCGGWVDWISSGGVCGLSWKRPCCVVALGGEMCDGLAAAIRCAISDDGVYLELSIRSCSLDLSGWSGLPKRSVAWCPEGGSSFDGISSRFGEELLLSESESSPCGCEFSDKLSVTSIARIIFSCSAVRVVYLPV